MDETAQAPSLAPEANTLGTVRPCAGPICARRGRTSGPPGGHHLWLAKLIGENGQVRGIEEIEAEVIRFAIEVYNGRMSEVARRLGIGRSTLYRKLKDYGLEEAAEREKS